MVEVDEDYMDKYFAVVYIILFVSGFFGLLWKRNEEPIKSRGWVLTSLQVLFPFLCIFFFFLLPSLLFSSFLSSSLLFPLVSLLFPLLSLVLFRPFLSVLYSFFLPFTFLSKSSLSSFHVPAFVPLLFLPWFLLSIIFPFPLFTFFFFFFF